VKLRVLVVDDSGFFRRRIRDMLNADPELEVIGEATTGREAIDMTMQLRPDVITMDIEMPELDGISAVRDIMRQRPTPILMFSSLTHEGAQATLDALEADGWPRDLACLHAYPCWIADPDLRPCPAGSAILRSLNHTTAQFDTRTTL